MIIFTIVAGYISLFKEFDDDEEVYQAEILWSFLQVFLLLYTVFLTVAGVHGFGQSIFDLSIDEAGEAVEMELVGQTFAVLGMAIAKVSLGAFLLRIVVQPWHRVAIWSSVISLGVVSVLTAIIIWVQRLPSRSIWDPRVEGRFVVSITPFAVLLGCELLFIFFLHGRYLRQRYFWYSLTNYSFSASSLVCIRGSLLCHLPMAFHLETQHEIQGEDDNCPKFKFGILVSVFFKKSL